MMSSPKFFAAAALLTALAIASCGGRTQTGNTRTKNIARAVPATPLSVPIEVAIADGPVEVIGTSAEAWRLLEASQPALGVRKVRAGGVGAVLIIGESAAPIAKLWLRGGSTAELTQDDDGALFVRATAGHARLRMIDRSAAAYVRAKSGLTDVRGDDVMLYHAAVAADDEAGTVLAHTAHNPRLADWALSLEAKGLDRGLGELTTAAAGGEVQHLALRRVKVNVTTHGALAFTEVEHVFHNDADEQIEGTFRFPMPDGAMVHSLAMEIKGELMEGEIVEKEKARKTYESIVDNMLDPALLEWERGNWFKLRVFPIEANSDKRVVLRYLAPLARTALDYEYVFYAAAPAMQKTINRFEMTFNGTRVHPGAPLAGHREIVVPVANDAVPAVAREVRRDGIYTALQVTPDLSQLAAPTVSGPRRVAIVFDTSRSALETRELSLHTLRELLSELADDDLFAIAHSDIATTFSTDKLVPATAEAVAEAIEFATKAEMDGATDVSAALDAAAKLSPNQVIYIGEGTPTWGITDGAALSAAAKRKLTMPVHAAIVGKGASTELWTQLTGASGGKTMRARTPLDAKQFALFTKHDRHVVRIADARIAAVDGSSVMPATRTTLFTGDALEVAVRTPLLKKIPKQLALVGTAGGTEFRQLVAIDKPVTTRFVAQRWAAQKMAQMTREGADKGDIVKMSRDFGILSKHTSLLVLESEEMYKQFDIERKRGKNAVKDGAPQVSGADLDSLSGDDASLSPDQIQPGDPEIKIPAPRDALSVVVVFPFGDTKIATYDEELGAWMVRFLIDKDTPDGTYHVHVKVTHKSGAVESLRLPYFVDTVAPKMKFRMKRVAGGGIELSARQQRDGDWRHSNDAKRVEVTLPGGEVVFLKQTSWGRFARTLPESKFGLAAGDASAPRTTTVTFTVTDRALNQAQHTATFEVD